MGVVWEPCFHSSCWQCITGATCTGCGCHALHAQLHHTHVSNATRLWFTVLPCSCRWMPAPPPLPRPRWFHHHPLPWMCWHLHLHPSLLLPPSRLLAPLPSRKLRLPPHQHQLRRHAPKRCRRLLVRHPPSSCPHRCSSVCWPACWPPRCLWPSQPPCADPPCSLHRPSLSFLHKHSTKIGTQTQPHSPSRHYLSNHILPCGSPY